MSDTPVTVITGATSGIGRAMAVEQARRGHRVVGVGRSPERLDTLRAELDAAAPELAHDALSLDVGDAADMGKLRDHMERIGRADVLIASAVLGRDSEGVWPPRTHNLPLGDWQRALDVNLHGVFLADQAVLPLMREAENGDLVHIGSSTTPDGLRGTPLAPAYCATKFALAELGHRMAEELGPEGIRVRTIFPGPVDTPLIASTLLDEAFGGRVTAEDFATTLAGLLELCQIMDLPDPHILPMPQYRAAKS